MANEIVRVDSDRALVHQKQPTFQVAVKQTKNPHKAQFFVDYGSEPGPWLCIGINSTVYGFGYLPKKKKRGSA